MEELEGPHPKPSNTDEHTYSPPRTRDIIQQGHIVMCMPQSEAATEIIFTRCLLEIHHEDIRGILLSLIMSGMLLHTQV
jgi:hypothetical protein